MRDAAPLPLKFSAADESTPATGWLRKWLWVAGVVWASAVLAVVASNALDAWTAPADVPRTFGHDFLPSYAAGRIVYDGHADKLYDPRVVQSIEQQIGRRFHLATDGRFGPFLNPPVYALLFVPLAKLPYPQAAAVWMWSGLAMLAASLVLLCRMLPRSDDVADRARDGRLGWRRWGLVPLFVLTSLPFWQAFCHQQNTFLSLALLCTAVACWRADRRFCAGLAAGLLFFKPQLGAAFAVVLVIAAGRRALAGVAVAGVVLLSLNLLVLPGTLGRYLTGLSPILYDIQFRHPFNWARQVTPHGFWRLLFQGRAAGETVPVARVLAAVTALAFGAGLACTLWRARRAAGASTSGMIPTVTRDRLIAATVAAMPLVMPYYMDYDLLLLAIPAVLLAADVARQMRAGRMSAPARADAVLLAGWAMLYVWHVGQSLVPALHGRVHLTVLLLGLVAVGQLRRAARSSEAEATSIEDDATAPSRPALAA